MNDHFCIQLILARTGQYGLQTTFFIRCFGGSLLFRSSMRLCGIDTEYRIGAIGVAKDPVEVYAFFVQELQVLSRDEFLFTSLIVQTAALRDSLCRKFGQFSPKTERAACAPQTQTDPMAQNDDT